MAVSAAERLLVASGDGHVGIPIASYRDYLEKVHHEAFKVFQQTHRNRWTPGHDDSVLTDAAWDWMRDDERYRSGGMESLSDPTRRLKEMDEDGIAVEILFPTIKTTTHHHGSSGWRRSGSITRTHPSSASSGRGPTTAGLPSSAGRRRTVLSALSSSAPSTTWMARLASSDGPTRRV
jgi:hypothetical protein